MEVRFDERAVRPPESHQRTVGPSSGLASAPKWDFGPLKRGNSHSNLRASDGSFAPHNRHGAQLVYPRDLPPFTVHQAVHRKKRTASPPRLAKACTWALSNTWLAAATSMVSAANSSVSRPSTTNSITCHPSGSAPA